MKEDVQEKIKHKRDQPAHCGFMRVKYEKDIFEGFKQRINNIHIVIFIQGLVSRIIRQTTKMN